MNKNIEMKKVYDKTRCLIIDNKFYLLTDDIIMNYYNTLNIKKALGKLINDTKNNILMLIDEYETDFLNYQENSDLIKLKKYYKKTFERGFNQWIITR